MTKKSGITHLFIPDTQVKPDDPIDHLASLGRYLVHRRPDTIIMAGDWSDMPSLSYYDKGTKAAEGVRYADDVNASHEAMEALLAPLLKVRRRYKPRMILTLGNHENRITKYVNANAAFDGKLSLEDLPYDKWEVYPFLQPVQVDGILYSHFFPQGPDGQVFQNTRGAPSAKAQVQRLLQSSTAGHKPGLNHHIHQSWLRQQHGLIAGSFYQHEESYLSPQGTAYWRGVVVKHDVDKGAYSPMFVSMDYLLRRFSR